MPEILCDAAILNVDDDEAGRHAVTRLLQRAGCTVQEASTGAEALRLAEEQPPSLVLLDVHLPDMSGFEVARRLRSDPATAPVPILHLSATASDGGSVAAGLDSGADGHLVAPVDPAVLLTTVRALLRARRAEQERERLLVEVEAERARWQGVVKGIADEMWVADAQGRMSLMNLPAVTAMGLEEFAGKSVHEVLEEVEILYPDGQVRPPEEAPLLRSLRGEIVRGEEIMRHRATGRRRYRQFSSAPTRDASGAITGAVAIVRDVTEQKQTEGALRESEARFGVMADARAQAEETLVQAGQMAHLGAWDIEILNPDDLSANPLHWSDEVYRIFGYEPGRVAVSNDLFLAHVPSEDRPRIVAAVAQAIAERQAYAIEHRIVRTDGAERIVLEHAQVTFNARGRPVRIVGAVQDITDRKQAEEERKRLQEQLLAAERARAELAEYMTAEINHRMKNNLTLLSGILEVQAMGQPRDGTAAHALRDAITRLTALSAVHEQLYEAKSARVDLRDVLQRVAAMDVQALAATEVSLQVRGEGTPVSSKLGSALALIGNELVSNALQYGAPGASGKLEIEVVVSQQDGDVRLRVWNSGPPVPEGFEVSMQTGLGLSLVHDVVVRQLLGSFTLCAEGGGVAAEAFIPERAVRAAEFVPLGEGRTQPSV